MFRLNITLLDELPMDTTEDIHIYNGEFTRAIKNNLLVF